MVISASLQACGVVFPFAMLISICRSIVTICSGLYLWMGMTRFSSKWILSHSTWYKNRRSCQAAQQFIVRKEANQDSNSVLSFLVGEKIRVTHQLCQGLGEDLERPTSNCRQ